MKRVAGIVVGVSILVLMGVAPAGASLYTESYETHPGGSGYAALVSSPNGLTYDVYHGRAFSRLAGLTLVLGPGDEKFYWGNNGMLPGPLYGEPGTFYCADNPTDYLFNGYGTGYGGTHQGDDFVLGINFANGPTNVYGATFGYASGSNAPTHHVTMVGLLSGLEVWSVEGDVGYGTPTRLTIPDSLSQVDRIAVVRSQNTTPLFGFLPVGWYTFDDLTYEISGDPSGEYQWEYYTREEYLGNLSPVPVPPALILGASGLAAALVGLRKKGRLNQEA
jgi:hypothetical protein